MNPSLYAAFLDRYPRTEYALMEEVCEDVQGGKGRADAMVLNFWRSRGNELHGFEIKSYRGDWLREKKDPSKAEALARFCDRWWLVDDSEEEAIKKEELPPTWGLLVRRGKKLIQVVAAPKLQPVERPWRFVCSLIRRAQDDVASAEKRAISGMREELRAEITAAHKEKIDRLHKELERERAKFADVETKLGVRISDWTCTPEQLAEAVEFIRHGGAAGMERNARNRLRQLANGAQAVADLIAPILSEEESKLAAAEVG